MSISPLMLYLHGFGITSDLLPRFFLPLWLYEVRPLRLEIATQVGDRRHTTQISTSSLSTPPSLQNTMETYTLCNFPSPYSTVHIALFHNVSNSPQIRKRLIIASTALGPEGDEARAEVDYAFLDGRFVSLYPLHHNPS